MRDRKQPRGAGRASVAATLVAVLALAAGCSSQPAPPRINVEAPLAGIGGSSATGSAILYETKTGVDVNLWLGNSPPGEYRIAIHANGLCSSPNGFSAGPPWGPPGTAPLAPVFTLGDDSRTIVVHLPGYRLSGPDGVTGRTVVIHSSASGSLDAQPGVRNNRMACGVIGNPVRMFPGLMN